MRTKICTHCKKRKTIDKFSRGNNKFGRASWCKLCVKQLSADPERRKRTNERSRLWTKNNPEGKRRLYLKFHYGITPEQHDKMLLDQNRKCKICGTKKPDNMDKRFCIDHSHKTGKVRGLLCRSCNYGLGLFKEDIRILKKAVEYLSESSTN